MGVYTPVNMQPWDSVIDATLANTFSCTVQGDSIQYYKVYIYNLSDGSQVYTASGTCSSILYNNDTFNISIPAATMTNGNDYKWVVKLSADNTNFYQSNEAPFYALKTPILSIDNFSANMETNKYNFTATYTQEQNILLKWYQWTLYDSFGNQLQQSKQIWGINPSYTFSGFINGYGYKVQVIGVDQKGVSIESSLVPFTANFDVGEAVVNATATVDCTRDSVKLTWPKIRQINGIATGTTDYENYNILQNYKSCINVLSGSYLEYLTNVEVDNIFTLLINTRLNDDGDIAQLKYQSSNRQLNLNYYLGHLYLDDNDSNHVTELNYIIVPDRADKIAIKSDGTTESIYIKPFSLSIDGGDSTGNDSQDRIFDGGNSTENDLPRIFIDGVDKSAILLGYDITLNNFSSTTLVGDGANANNYGEIEILSGGGVNEFYANL